MKLIVDIPDNWEKELNQSKITFADVVDIDTVRNGIPLDKIKAEIARLHYHPKLDFIKNDEVVDMALDIIDKYKAESGE